MKTATSLPDEAKSPALLISSVGATSLAKRKFRFRLTTISLHTRPYCFSQRQDILNLFRYQHISVFFSFFDSEPLPEEPDQDKKKIANDQRDYMHPKRGISDAFKRGMSCIPFDKGIIQSFSLSTDFHTPLYRKKSAIFALCKMRAGAIIALYCSAKGANSTISEKR